MKQSDVLLNDEDRQKIRDYIVKNKTDGCPKWVIDALESLLQSDESRQRMLESQPIYQDISTLM